MHMRQSTVTEKSLSARRAWIEIDCGVFVDVVPKVALRKESVDRNHRGKSIGVPSRLSLSARRAWIEIRQPELAARSNSVALRKESVDRNSLRWLYDNP